MDLVSIAEELGAVASLTPSSSKLDVERWALSVERWAFLGC